MSYDESYENARPIAPQMGDAELLLNDVIDIIVNAPNMPLSSTPRSRRCSSHRECAHDNWIGWMGGEQAGRQIKERVN